MPALKPCLSCGALSPSSRCPTCESTRNKQRGSSTQRSYGYAHQAMRATLLELYINTPCPRCGGLMLPGQTLDLGHSTSARKQAGLPGDRIEHAACNRGNR